MSTPTQAQRLAELLAAGAPPEDSRALLEALSSGRVSSIFEKMEPPQPILRPVPTVARGFRVRLDLDGAKPPVWRRLELPGDLTLPRMHDVMQAAMGWTDSHLHRFRTGSDPRAPYFLTNFDVSEGDEGVLEDDVRLDQLVVDEGDALWYEYDFGDGWEHVLRIEAILDEPPAAVRCIEGRLACPPEDCGGMGGYEDLASWVRSGYDAQRLPEVFEDAAHAHGWLPTNWHPDRFDVDEVNSALAAAVAEPVAVTGELAELVEQLESRGIRALREVLGRPFSHGPAEVGDAEAARLTSTYRVLLDVVGDGVTLTGAGYLPPAVVADFAERSGIADWWIGKVNREDQTAPVANVRSTARALGLVTVRRGRLTPTAAGTRFRQHPQALWRHIVGRLPLGTKDIDRDAGWLALAVAGSGTPAEDLREEVAELLFALGWRTGRDGYSRPSPHSPTLSVLDVLAGAERTDWRLTGTDPAVAATARAVIHRG